MRNDMALFLYGFDVVTDMNRYLNFDIGGSELTAILNIGNYTATEFFAEVKRAMEVADPSNTYSVTINRAVNGGLENRVTIATSGSTLNLLFGSGSNAGDTSVASVLGFAQSDLTGATFYVGFQSAGTILRPDFPTYNYVGPDDNVLNEGVKNVSATGVKETVVFAQQRFFEGEWRYITNFNGNTQKTQWQDFLKYATKQLGFEFTASIYEDAEAFIQATLESTPEDGTNGLAFKLKLMQDKGLYRFHTTGLLKFRVRVPT